MLVTRLTTKVEAPFYDSPFPKQSNHLKSHELDVLFCVLRFANGEFCLHDHDLSMICVCFYFWILHVPIFLIFCIALLKTFTIFILGHIIFTSDLIPFIEGQLRVWVLYSFAGEFSQAFLEGTWHVSGVSILGIWKESLQITIYQISVWLFMLLLVSSKAKNGCLRLEFLPLSTHCLYDGFR